MDLLNTIIRKCATILKLLASEDQVLLVRRDAILVLHLGLQIVILSEDSTLRVIILPMRVLTKIEPFFQVYD